MEYDSLLKKRQETINQLHRGLVKGGNVKPPDKVVPTSQVREDSMEAIRPVESQNSVHSAQSKEEKDGYASDSESDIDQRNNNDAASISSRASSTAGDLPKSRNTTAGKDSRKSTGRGGRSAHSVSFSRANSRAVEKRMRFDGQEVTMVTLTTQTDWDWLETAQHVGKAKVLVPSEELTFHTSTSGASLKSILIKPESRETTSRPRTELGASSAADSRAETDYTPYSLQPNDEYGIPLLEMSSTSDDSSDDEAPKKKRAPRVSLPSVGPPQILKYVRESDMPNEEAVEDEGEATSEVEDLDLPVDEDGKAVGMFAGPCEFCTQPIQPMPTLEMQQSQDPSSLYCCEDYREFIEFATSTAMRMEQEAQKATKMISIKPHPHHGSKQARRAAKERAVERMRQRELVRRQQEALGSQANFYSSRQMKTINYQLSSQRCLEEGWTLRAPSPLEIDETEAEVFIPEPLHPAMIASGNIRDRQLIERYYPNGEKFLTVFPDGTGNVFYPSGRLAVLISSVTLGQYSYIIQDDTPDAHILANFDPTGFGCVYFLNGNVKLYYDQLGGMEVDVFGAKRRRWSWKDQETHVHAPPFQPICLRLNRHSSLRIMSQESIALTFMASKRSCRFGVGARLKLVAPELIPRKEIDEHQLFIDERSAQVENILNKVSVLLKFPKSPKVDKILPPLHVTSKMHKNEKMRKELSASVRASTEGKATKGKSNAFPVVSVN